MTPTIQFLGVGGAFAPINKGNSNMLISGETGKRMLVDCGSSLQYILQNDFSLDPRDIDAIWISHLHADHIGSLEWFAFYRHFLPKKDRDGNVVKPKLYMVPSLMRDLWETSLRGGMQCIGNKLMHLTDYFECIPVEEHRNFVWDGISFTPIKARHVSCGYASMDSYGLFASNCDTKYNTYITTDASFCPDHLRWAYENANQIFHDCETLDVRSGVHAHYYDLCTLPPEIKTKMWLYHYATAIGSYENDGFCGFVVKGQTFLL